MISVESPRALAERLEAEIVGYRACLIAFSGGVDSGVVAAAAHRAIGDRAVAVTAVSPSLSQTLRVSAERVAHEIGIRHEWLCTEEVADPSYIANDLQRCYHCKTHLYQGLKELRRRYPNAVIASGTNSDDLKDYRPGIQAGREADVKTPLADLGVNKAAVRQLAHYYRLSIAEQPASPCLSSRIAHGVAVTPERLRRIDEAEQWLRARGFVVVRVRLHAGEMARVEVGSEQLPELVASHRAELIKEFRRLGFQAVTVDLEGFRSGSLHQIAMRLSADAGDRLQTE